MNALCDIDIILRLLIVIMPWLLVMRTCLLYFLHEYETVTGAGITVWLYDNEIVSSDRYDDRRDAMFVVKLVPPYIGTEEMVKNDPIEGKPHRAIINKIYVDVVGIWIYKSESRRIVRKESGDKKWIR